MTGVSYMIPFVVPGGILIAIGFAIGGIYVYETPVSALTFLPGVKWQLI